MHEALCPILCGEDKWLYYTQDQTYIKFNRDGTGELWCSVNFTMYMAMEIEWKSLDLYQPDKDQDGETARASGKKKVAGQLLGHLNVEITFTKRVVPGVPDAWAQRTGFTNDRSLRDNAFRTETFTVRVEKGNFIEPIAVGYASARISRYALGLVFDKSPYPPREGWKEPGA